MNITLIVLENGLNKREIALNVEIMWYQKKNIQLWEPYTTVTEVHYYKF